MQITNRDIQWILPLLILALIVEFSRSLWSDYKIAIVGVALVVVLLVLVS